MPMSAQRANISRKFDVNEVRADFPILSEEIHGQPLVYLDNAATTQKPQCVIDALVDYYSHYNSNVHRGAHTLGDRATAAFEAARKTIAKALNSPQPEQLIWTRGTTEAINLVAHSWGGTYLRPGDQIVLSTLEHHSNIVPWQLVAQRCGAEIVPAPLREDGAIDIDRFQALLSPRVKLVALNHVSNALGVVNPIKVLTSMAKQVDATVLIDGAQGVAHFPVDVQDLGCDFYAFSGHKVFGPTGIGCLWGASSLLDAMPPYQSGGEMIERVSFSGTTFNQLPYKFEAGTPDIAGAIGLASAFDYLGQFDRAEVLAHENDLLSYCRTRLSEIDGLQKVGHAEDSASVFSFLVDGTHPSDIGMLLDQQAVAVRTGHHCAQPLMAALAIPGTVRASFSIYNTREDVDRLLTALQKVMQFLR